MRVVWPPHVDYLRACSAFDVEPSDDFVERGHRWWRPGWWAQVKRTERGSQVQADAEAAARSWPQPFRGAYHVTRVDLACDVVLPSRAAFTMEHRLLFTCRGTRKTYERKDELVTFYIGSRESPVMLRVYRKSDSAKVTERDLSTWRRNGWNGRDAVWRIEYEMHTKALPTNLQLPNDVERMWADCLARIRMCERPPRLWSQQNKAPTHPWWRALGHARRMTRRGDLARYPAAPDELTTARALAALERLVVRSGAGMLPAMRARLEAMARTTRG